MTENEYALSKLKQAIEQDEAWTNTAFAWNKGEDEQVSLMNTQNANNPVSFIEAVEAGNIFALEKFRYQQTTPESLERLDIIKIILALDLDIEVMDEYISKNISKDIIESKVYQENYTFESIFPVLEKNVFDKVNRALEKHSKWKRAKILLGECYKLGIGTEQSLARALGEFYDVEYNHNSGDEPINFSDICFIMNYEEISSSLELFLKGSLDFSVPEIEIGNQDICEDLVLYPEPNNVFVSEQQWLAKHLMPVMQVNLGMLNAEWKGINLPICLAYEPTEGETVGENTKKYHNEFLAEGWFSFRLSKNNQYEFLGDEKFFYFADHEDKDEIINTRKDIYSIKQKYLETGDFFREKHQDGEYIQVPVSSHYLELGGNSSWEYYCALPRFYCQLSSGRFVTMDDKLMYHITTINEGNSFAKYNRMGYIDVFFEPNSRLVLYSCKYIRSC